MTVVCAGVEGDGGARGGRTREARRHGVATGHRRRPVGGHGGAAVVVDDLVDDDERRLRRRHDDWRHDCERERIAALVGSGAEVADDWRSPVWGSTRKSILG